MITINVNKARGIAHEKRRQARAVEFAPYDDIIAKQIPGNTTAEAESKRKEIRDRYAGIQQQIDAASSVDELKLIVDSL